MVPAQTQGVLNVSNRQSAWWESQVCISMAEEGCIQGLQKNVGDTLVGYTLLGRHSMLSQFLSSRLSEQGTSQFQITGPRITEVLREASLSRPLWGWDSN